MRREHLTMIAVLFTITSAVVLPLAVFAAPKNGDRCTTDYVDTLVGSDGGYYYRSGTQTSIKYLKDGSTVTFFHENYDGPRRHYLIKPDGQDNYYGYCIEQGLSYPDDSRYTGIGWEEDPYLDSLPETVRNGMMLATIYGRQPNKSVPVSGCNDDDWYWATQIVIWEYQQKLRSSPTKLQSNGHVPADYFHSTLDGRPAEKCYDYILSAMADHQKIPSFAKAEPGEASTNVLKWNAGTSSWEIVLHDTNQIRLPLHYDYSNLKLSRNGDDYAFTTKKKITGVTLAFKKDIDLPSHDMLVWGSATGTQSIVTGTADPLVFYVRFRTEQPGTFEIIKTSEDGVKDGFEFQLTDAAGKTTSHATDGEGIIRLSLFPGEYQLVENEPDRYRHPQDVSIRINENETGRIQVQNILKKGRIQILKTAKDEINGETRMESNATFQIYPIQYGSYDSAPEPARDEITTDAGGSATTKELPLGKYEVHQTAASKNVACSPDLDVEVKEDMETVALPIENPMQAGKIIILKTDACDQPLPGAVFTVRAAEDIFAMGDTPRHKKGELVGTLISGPDGTAGTEWLYPGKYLLEEIMAPKGFYLPEEPVATIDLAPPDMRLKTFTLRSVIQNEPVVDVPNTGQTLDENNQQILYSLMLIGLNGMLIMFYISRERNNKLR